MTVHTEAKGRVLVVTIDRPEVRNAVDRPTAEALADAFRSFESDEDLLVAVLTGAGGYFCAGADLKAMANDPERANRIDAEGDGPMGPTRMQLRKPTIAAIEGYELARFPQAVMRADMWSAKTQWAKSSKDAMAQEFADGIAAAMTGETHRGAERFAAGKGRHGDFDDI